MLRCFISLFYLVVQAIIVEFLGKFAKTEKLSWQLWLVSIGIGFIRLVAFPMADSKLKLYFENYVLQSSSYY